MLQESILQYFRPSLRYFEWPFYIGFTVVTQLRKSGYDFFYVFDTLWKRLMESLSVNSVVFVYHTENPETR